MPRVPGRGWRWQSSGGNVWVSIGSTIYTWHVEVYGLQVTYISRRYRRKKY